MTIVNLEYIECFIHRTSHGWIFIFVQTTHEMYFTTNLFKMHYGGNSNEISARKQFLKTKFPTVSHQGVLKLAILARESLLPLIQSLPMLKTSINQSIIFFRSTALPTHDYAFQERILQQNVTCHQQNTLENSVHDNKNERNKKGNKTENTFCISLFSRSCSVKHVQAYISYITDYDWFIVFLF